MSYNRLNGGLGWGVFVIGVSCFFTNSLAVIWGRRPIFLLGNLLLFVRSSAACTYRMNSLTLTRQYSRTDQQCVGILFS